MACDSPIAEAHHITRMLSGASHTAPPNRDRVLGSMLGLAVGNILGLPVEGWSHLQIVDRYPDGVTEIDPLEKGRPMDDDLAQAVDLAESLLLGGDFVADFTQRLVRWRNENGRGIGSTTAAVIDLLEEGHHPLEAARIIYEERNFIAPNGGLMRCAPVALACHSNPERLVSESAGACAVTHYAPFCQWSCILINAAIFLLLKGKQPGIGELVSAARADGAPSAVGDWASRVGHEVGEMTLDQGLIGHTLRCMQAGLWALITPLDLESALVRVVSAGGDTDTNGAVAGAVLGARFGAAAIPRRWLDCIPQRERLEELALKLVNAAP